MDPNIILRPGDWCTPAMIYGIFLLIGIIAPFFNSKRSMRLRLLDSLINLIWGIVMLYALLILCDLKLEWAAWGLLLLPLFLVLIVMLMCPVKCDEAGCRAMC